MEKEISISFTGDISFSGYFAIENDTKIQFDKEIVDFLKSSDYVVANIEAPITDNIPKSVRALNHASNPKCIEILNKLGINVWNLGNNHILDCGSSGLKDTLSIAKELNIPTIGAGLNIDMAIKPYIIDSDIKIGLFTITKPWEYVKADKNKAGTVVWTNEKLIKDTIKELKKKVDRVIVVAHGGEEFTPWPMPYVRSVYLQVLNWGADIIVGHHPHVVESYEFVGDKIIFYSLGNFIFDTNYQRIQKGTEFGVLLKLKLTKEKIGFESIFIKNTRDSMHLVTVPQCADFKAVTAEEYKEQWSIYAAKLHANKKRALLFKLKALKKNLIWLRFIKNELCELLDKEGRNIIWGNILAKFK